ncbi:MAG: DUF3365 domain-containing protein [Nitrospiraceae bacterium]|nr:DUF3365 domain-containing protein [Nitrospiraceae bacterium]
MQMRGFCFGLAVGTIVTSLLGQWGLSVASKEADAQKGIAPQRVADYIHSVLQADRTFYSTEVVDRMQKRGIVFASEHWRQDGDLPLPAQFLLESGRLVAKQPNNIKFRLISNWAINRKNGPATDFERTALTEMLTNTERPYTGIVSDGKTRVFQAIYPDKALSSTCAHCHNVHPESPKRDFKVGDVMGGVLITIPLAN